MIRFSRKKIRGFNRKIRQLENWKKFILTYPFEKRNNKDPEIFRIHLRPFLWFNGKNPSVKLHEFLYKAFAEILIKLETDEKIVAQNLEIQLWLNYPRTIQSAVIVGTKDQFDLQNKKIDAKLTNLNLPKFFNGHFDEREFKIGNDVNYEFKISKDGKPIWTPHEKGDIWIVQ